MTMLNQPYDSDPFAEFETSKPKASGRMALEEEIIGSVLANELCYRGARMLRSDDFHDIDHQEVWKTIREWVEQSIPLDAERIAQSVFTGRVIDLPLLAKRASGNIDGIERAAIKLADSNRRAWLDRVFRTALADLGEHAKSWRDIVHEVETSLQTNAETGLVSDAASVRAALLRRLHQHTGQHIPIGIGPIDRHLGGGIMNGTFVMAGALGKTGKTVFLTSISYNWDKAGIDHLFITMERSSEVIESLKIAREIGVSARRLTEHLQQAASVRPQSHTRYLHSTNIDVDQIRHETLFQKKRFGIRAVLIDYWQLIQGRRKGESIHEFRGRTAQEIQRTAIDADLPILMTCQVSDSAGVRDWESAKTAANLFLQINRDRSSAETWFQVITTNVTEEADIGSIANPPVVLRDEGPHFAAV
jgi:replicative DNA helicase